MIHNGVFPAAVTPFDAKGRIDFESLAKLLAHFEAAGCTGAVLAGTNGEGPSLSAVEKRDLLKIARPLAGKLQLILGVATPSLDEAIWLAKRSGEFGADGLLLMPPYYFRNAPIQGVEAWFRAVLDASEVPVLLYNYPKASGIPLPHEMLGRLGEHPKCAGSKDSSGDKANLTSFRAALPLVKRLFVGDETILDEALASGWSGTISGVANVISPWLCAIVRDFESGEVESAQTKFETALPAIRLLRSHSQPNLNKAILAKLRVIAEPSVRLPLMECDSSILDSVLGQIADHIGPLRRI